MTTQQTYALLALHVYDAKRLDNKPLPPPPWTEIPNQPTGTDGFAYAVYKNPDTNEVVIAFRGTDNDFSDWTTNLGLSISQEKQAAAVYARVLRDYGTDAQGSTLNNITFTGHSLGGGLAGTMAVWFNRPAVVFDPAPSEAGAKNAASVSGAIMALGANVPQALRDYQANIDSTFAARESNVSSYYAPGSVVFATTNAGNTITGAGQGNPVQFGIANMGDIGGKINMHSQALLTAGLLSDSFKAATVTVQTVLPVVMDRQLYSLSPVGSERNFLIDLIRSEQKLPSNGKLTHFAADLQKLGTNIAGLSKAAQEALIAQGIEWYYWQGTDYAGKEFFTKTGALLQYTTAKGDGLAGAQNKAAQYLKPWLDGQLGVMQPTTLLTIVPNYSSYEQWNVSANSTGVTAVARDGSKTQIFIGQSGADSFTGGSKNDLLAGGAGSDTYSFTGTFGKDIVLDSDGSGHITLDGAAIGVAKGFGKPNQYKADLGGGGSAILTVFADSASSTGYRMVIAKEGDSANTITVKNFDLNAAKHGGYLGITIEPMRLALQAVGTANPFAHDTPVANLNATFTEGGGGGYKAYLDQAAKAGDTITLSASGNGCLFDLQAQEDATNLVAAHARYSGVAGRTDCQKLRIQTPKQARKRGLNSKTPHAYSMRLAGQKWLERRMDSAWGTSGSLACIAVNASNCARSAA